ncbi:hypothetical protein [Halomicrococcus sp. SG-WS-1]
MTEERAMAYCHEGSYVLLAAATILERELTERRVGSSTAVSGLPRPH